MNPPSGASSLLQHLGWTIPAPFTVRNGWGDEALTAAATTLRQFHDAQAGYSPPPDATWCEWFADWPARTRP